MIRAAIFDMDGLLIDSEPFWRKAEIEAFAEVGLTLTEDDCRETMGYRLNEVVALWYSRRPWAQLSQKEVEDNILKKVSHYIETEGQALEGALELIEACKHAGLKTAIASSSPLTLINSVVKRLGIKESLDFIHSAQHEAFGKPHPAVFIATAIKLGVQPEECVVFEDSFHGVVAGLAAKMKTIVVPDSENFDSPKFAAADLKFKSLNDFDLKAFTGSK